jgi:hypothetical protein
LNIPAAQLRISELRSISNTLDLLSRAPISRRNAFGAPKGTRKMALVRKPAELGHVRKASAAPQQRLGAIDTPSRKPLVWRNSHALSKRVCELSRAQAAHRGNLSQAYTAIEMRLDHLLR